MLLILGLLALSGVNGAAHAEDAIYQTEVDPSLQIIIPTDLIKVYVEPGSKPFDANSVDISVSTNSHAGYYLTMSSDSTSLLKIDDANKELPTLSANEGGYTDETFEANKWGYKIGSANYIPFVSGAEIASSDTKINDDITTLTFAAKVDYSQPSGVYQTVLDFFAVANPTIMAIQNLDAAYCTETPMVVVDARDGEEYTIQKLADGNCWMLDNLRLDPSEVSLAALKGRTNATNESLTYLKNGGGVSPYPAEGVIAEFNVNDPYKPIVYAEYKDTVIENTLGIGSGKAGVIYNMCAASAGTVCYESESRGNVTQDICPAGWRLPTGNNTGEYKALYDKYATSTNDDQNAYNFIETLSIPIAQTSSSFDYDIGENSNYFWTSTYSGDHENYSMEAYKASSWYSTYFWEDKSTGMQLAVRCMMIPTIASATSLQDITQQMVDNTAIGATAIIKDKRDNETYKIGKLADGNIWMLENLRIDPTTVSLETLQGNTNASDETLNYLKNGGGTDQYAAEAVAIATNTSRRDTPTVVVEYKDTVPPTTNGSSGRAGVYYSYCAASAGSFCYSGYAPYVPGTSDAADLTEDICPAGWRIPTGHYRRDSNSNYKYSDYRNLMSAYDSLPDFFAAFHITLSYGFYSYWPGYSFTMGSYGYLWAASQEVPGSGNLITFSWGSSPTFNIAGTDRSRIFNIRCMYKN